MTDKNLASLRGELIAIALWDAEYEEEQTHSDLQQAAYAARRNRRREIMKQISEFAPGEDHTGRLWGRSEPVERCQEG